MRKLLFILCAGLVMGGTLFLNSCDDKNEFSNDKEKPVVKITAPTADKVFDITEKITLTGSISDNDALARGGWKIEGSQMMGTFKASGKSCEFNETIPIAQTLADGKYVLTVYAIDQAGNKGESSVNIEIKRSGSSAADTEAPTVKITSPAASGYEIAPGFNIQVIGEASDNIGVASVKIVALKGTEEEVNKVELTNTGKTVAIRAELDIKTMKNGESGTLKITVADAAGNITTQDIPFMVKAGGEEPNKDMEPPQLTINSPKADGTTKIKSGEKLSIDLTATDNVKVAKIEYEIHPKDSENKLSGEVIHEGEGTSVPITKEVEAPAEAGEYRLIVKVSDGEGTPISQEVNFTVEAKSPAAAVSIEITAPAENAQIEINKEFHITGQITNNTANANSKIVITGPEPEQKEIKKFEDLGTDETVSFDKTFTFTDQTAGTYTIKVINGESTANETSKSVKITLVAGGNPTQPTIEVVSPKEGSETDTKKDLEIEINFSDKIGLKNAEIKLITESDKKTVWSKKIELTGKEQTSKLTVKKGEIIFAGGYSMVVTCTNSSNVTAEKTVKNLARIIAIPSPGPILPIGPVGPLGSS